MRRSLARLSFALSLVACGASGARPSQAPKHEGTAPAPTPQTGAQLCAVLTAKSKEVRDQAVAKRKATYDEALASKREGVPDTLKLPENLSELSTAVGTCYPYATGAWSLQLEALELGDWANTTDASARWAIVHADAFGNLERLDVETFGKGEEGTAIANANCCHRLDGWLSIGQIETFDFDGDGVPEFFVRNDAVAHHGYAQRRAYFLRFTGNSISELSGDYDELDDVDRDGRPDGVTTTMTEDCSDEMGNCRQVRERRAVYISKPNGEFELQVEAPGSE